MIHPPETDLRDAANYGMVPPNVNASSTYFIVAPGASFGAGTPELTDGSINSGFSWGMDPATGDLVFYTHSGITDRVEAFRMELSSQDFKWRSGTSFNGILSHNNTGHKTYDFPDATGGLPVLIATAAAGGGAGATLPTIGGSGPTVAAAAGWRKFTDPTGTYFMPYWI